MAEHVHAREKQKVGRNMSLKTKAGKAGKVKQHRKITEFGIRFQWLQKQGSWLFAYKCVEGGGGESQFSAVHFNFLLKICFPKQLQESAANSKSKNESHMVELGRRQEEGTNCAPVNPLGPAAHLCCLQAFQTLSTHGAL